ncbi:MAG TPA: hypothetical protein VEW95_07440 [Candidatus Limnocylindrales bacterium]|nr:hypothetical protein [Candidatus Limnocylindrales bacterium]
MTFLAGIAFMAALAAPGIAVLRRAADRLAPLETIAYGAPLGAVLGTLAILLLARLMGLPAATILVGAAAVAAALLVSFPWSASSPRQQPDLRHLWQRAMRSLSEPSILVPALVVGLVIARWLIFWSEALLYGEAGMVANHVNVFGDLPVHLGNATSFAFGDNFPPEHPRFAGHPLAYHHLTDLTAASLITLGVDPGSALTMHSAVFSALVGLAIFAFALRLTRDRGVAALALVLFVLSGSLGWLEVVGQMAAAPDSLGGRLWAFERVREAGYEWQNIFYGFLMPQRAFLYGMPLAFLALTLALDGKRRDDALAFVAAGAVVGLLPLAHLATMLALAIATPFIALLLPTRKWIGFFAAWILVALPQLLLQQGGAPGALASLRFQLGWVMGSVPWPLFWLKQVGLFLPLVVVALALPRLLPRDSYRLLAAFMSIFVAANILVFQPWDWDNHKVLVYWFLATCVLVAALLVHLWRRRGVAVRLMVVAGVMTMLMSGILEDLNQLLGRDRYPLFTAEEIAFAAQVRDDTPPDAVFATAPINNNPVGVLAGRRVLLGYPGWLFAEGLPWQARDADLRTIYAFADGAEALLDQYAVDYVVIGPVELATMGPDVEAYRSRYRAVITSPNYEVFEIDR